jgi:predicted chitinase
MSSGDNKQSNTTKVDAKYDSDVTDSLTTPNATPEIVRVYITSGFETGETSKTITLNTPHSQGLFTRKYYLVVQVKNFPEDSDATIKLSIRSKEKGLTDKDEAIKLLLGESEAEMIEIFVDNFHNDDSIENKADFANMAVVAFSFNRQDDLGRNDYKDLLVNPAKLYIKVDEILGVTGVTCHGDVGTEDNKCFYYEKPFMLLKECFCDRNITATELRSIVTALNDNKEKNLFTHNKCTLKTTDKTYERLAEELNATFTKYQITTCNRKAHFIAQLYHESANLSTAEEFANGNNYELANWETRVTDLENKISSIDTLKPNVDSIVTRLGQTAIDETKSQIDAINSKIPNNANLNDSEKITVATYKAIFEETWKPNFDLNGTEIYTTKARYVQALATARSRVLDRQANGNTSNGDGPRYKGKGVIQLTWRNTYEAYFRNLIIQTPVPDTVRNKTVEQLLDRTDNDQSKLLATDLFYAVDSAGWFWEKYKKIDAVADYDGDCIVNHGRRKNISALEKITRMVNGGVNGLQDRIRHYNKIRNDIFKIGETCLNFNDIRHEA